VVIVGGEFVVEPDQREEFIAGRGDAMLRSRAEPGCLEYTFAADPLVAGRVVLYERWESQEHLDVHLSGLQSSPPPPAGGIQPKSVSIMLYDVSGERRLQ
jgi:quinol monooxygenase YgiN